MPLIMFIIIVRTIIVISQHECEKLKCDLLEKPIKMVLNLPRGGYPPEVSDWMKSSLVITL